jgi:tetratricopeptide (TPR) repeat protein
MQYRRWLAPVVLFLLTPHVHAQTGGGSLGGVQISRGSVHVHVVFASNRRAGNNLLVRLMQGPSSTPVETTFTNDAGKADFWNIPIGTYHVVVSGEGIQTTDGELFELDARQVSQSQYVTVREMSAEDPKPMASKSGTVSASDLNIPAKARKELDKANEAMGRQDWNKAAELLNQAIAIYPQYVGAYNNLGVVYSRLNDTAHEQEALEKAISLDEHFAPAYENLAKLYLRQKEFSQAETLLGKALTVDPNNGQNLTLLADTQYMERHYDDAIASARKAHGLPNVHPSVVHYIAGKAYEQENRKGEALAEFQTFLKEEPNGPRADHVRSDIARMGTTPQ